MHRSLKLGLVGTTIDLALNLFALVVLKKHAAEFFSPDWWSTWFPNYLVWLAFLVLGGIGQFRGAHLEPKS